MKGVEVLCAMSCAYYMLGSLSLSLPPACYGDVEST